MELMSLKCPHCGGSIKFVSATSGKCEHCGSTFVFSDGGADAETFKPDVYAYAIPFEPAIFFAEKAKTIEVSRSVDIFMGKWLTPKKVDRARAYFEIPASEDVFMVMDTSIFNTVKVGLACCTSGIYLRDHAGELEYMSWSDFAKMREGQIRIYDDNFVLGKHVFVLYDKDKAFIKNMFREIWRRLQVPSANA